MSGPTSRRAAAMARDIEFDIEAVTLIRLANMDMQHGSTGLTTGCSRARGLLGRNRQCGMILRGAAPAIGSDGDDGAHGASGLSCADAAHGPVVEGAGAPCQGRPAPFPDARVSAFLFSGSRHTARSKARHQTGEICALRRFHRAGNDEWLGRRGSPRHRYGATASEGILRREELGVVHVGTLPNPDSVAPGQSAVTVTLVFLHLFVQCFGTAKEHKPCWRNTQPCGPGEEARRETRR